MGLMDFIKGEAIDARVDVYAIGVMFYLLLAGRLPFAAENNAALLYKHVHEPPPPLASRLPEGHDIPPGLIALVHRCLAKEPAERPADANAVVAGLVACVPGELFHLPVGVGDGRVLRDVDLARHEARRIGRIAACTAR